MKLTVIVPSGQYLESAGTRIRYLRLQEPLLRAGCRLAIATTDSLETGARSPKDCVFLFSKVQDARGLALARELRASGGHVGVDLFDDYFSQVSDSRFALQRLWLREMAKSCDFYLCSTERMRQIAECYFNKVPGHVLSDPFVQFEPELLARQLDEKRYSALERKTIDVMWFGIGDNPNFPVGLHDLTRFGGILAQFHALGLTPNLTVLTNARAMSPAGLAMLRQLPVQPRIQEWTLAREATLLAKSLVSFLPVNYQEFSIAKSLNRAVTALTGGTQVLVAGHPLYRQLGDFLYSDPNELIEDLVAGNLRVRPDKMPSLCDALNHMSNPLDEAAALHGFLDAIKSQRKGRSARKAEQIAIIHGAQSTSAIHKLALQRQWLSLGSPFASQGPAYHAHLAVFELGAAPVLRMSKSIAARLPKNLSRKTRKVVASSKGLTIEISAEEILPGISGLLACLASEGRPAGRMVLQRRVLETSRQIFIKALGPMVCIDSELDLLFNQGRELTPAAGQAES